MPLAYLVPRVVTELKLINVVRNAMRPAVVPGFNRPALFSLVLLSALAAANCGSPKGLRINPQEGDPPSQSDRRDPRYGDEFEVDDSPLDPNSLLITDETPRQLVCRRMPGSTLVGEMTYTSLKGSSKVGRFTLNGNVGACELSRRAARNGLTCIESGSAYSAIKLSDRSTVKSFGNKFYDCLKYTQNHNEQPDPSNSLNFIDTKELKAYLNNLPEVNDPQINAVIHAKDTIWYDEDSMHFVYQDSFGNPTGPEGLRGNRVAYDVGSTASEPGIKALTEYFELQTFKYPFSITAGRLDRGNSEAIYFWQPPRDASGQYVPVAWWKNGSHWHWVFPKGTVLGELLLVRDSGSKSEWYVHEIRTRVREIDRWRTDIFRPFPKATDFSYAIKKARPNWQETDLKQLVAHLEDTSTLTPGRLDSKSYEKAVPSINGYYDKLPSTTDHALIRSLLRNTVFKSAMNTEWKRSGDKVSFAPATDASFHIVPKKYIAGLLENNETSCMRCHNQAGRPLGQLDSRTILYGEVWGQDQIFTWHPFKPITEIYSVSDGSRVANPKLVSAGLLLQRKPAANDQVYRELPRAYSPIYK